VARIMIIDDSVSALALMEIDLTAGGHTVISLCSARGAMKLVAESMVDLIITDVYMPDKDGLEVILEARKTYPNIPVIAVSGVAGQKNMLHDAQLLGAACTLQKPFAKQRLLDAVAAVLAPVAPGSAVTTSPASSEAPPGRDPCA
jgi:DNA-binding NtrC family response regulator